MNYNIALALKGAADRLRAMRRRKVLVTPPNSSTLNDPSLIKQRPLSPDESFPPPADQSEYVAGVDPYLNSSTTYSTSGLKSDPLSADYTGRPFDLRSDTITKLLQAGSNPAITSTTKAKIDEALSLINQGGQDPSLFASALNHILNDLYFTFNLGDRLVIDALVKGWTMVDKPVCKDEPSGNDLMKWAEEEYMKKYRNTYSQWQDGWGGWHGWHHLNEPTKLPSREFSEAIKLEVYGEDGKTAPPAWVYGTSIDGLIETLSKFSVINNVLITKANLNTANDCLLLTELIDYIRLEYK